MVPQPACLSICLAVQAAGCCPKVCDLFDFRPLFPMSAPFFHRLHHNCRLSRLNRLNVFNQTPLTDTQQDLLLYFG